MADLWIPVHYSELVPATRVKRTESAWTILTKAFNKNAKVIILYCSYTASLGFGETPCFINIKFLFTSLFVLCSLQMCLQDVKVPATAGCMVGGIMDQARDISGV